MRSTPRTIYRMYWHAGKRATLSAGGHANEQSFLVSRSDIAVQGYDLSLNRYKEVVHDKVDHRAPREIIAELRALEAEIAKGLSELEGMM